MIDDFSPNGFLSQVITDFNPRPAQQVMAKAVSEAIKKKSTLVIEAGTGTGKTFAYLFPLLRSGKKTVVSTGSKTLQDQLFLKDLPLLLNAISYVGKTALLKGRSNYLCLERMNNHIQSNADLSESLLQDLVNIRYWSSQTVDGDTTLCSKVNEDSAIWPYVTSTNDNCLGSDCPFYQECFVLKARRKAMAADVVVINHHLFFADLSVKETGFGELLPQVDTIIFDEAHQLPDIASQYFGKQLSSRQLIDVAKDINLLYRTEVRDLSQLQKCSDSLNYATQDLRLVLGEPGFRGDLRDIISRSEIKKAKEKLLDALNFCRDVLKLAINRSSGIESCYLRIENFLTLLEHVSNVDVEGYSYWYECSPLHFQLCATPLSVSDEFKNLMQKNPISWIFTSATLAVNNQLDYFNIRLGLEQTKTLILDSPFNYKDQALLCVPRYLPEANSKGLATYLTKTLTPVIMANKGRCFFLCTSYHMMKELTNLLRETLTYPVLMQGETSKNKLLDEFIQKGNAILVATQSFWEGIDVKGETLSCVIIDKLPFSAPDDPLLKARIEECKRKNKDPFYEIQLPEAVITLKQGVGRLIRHHNDKGVIIICDSRIVMRPYGSVFLNSLPAFSRTRDISKTIDFLTKS